MSGNKEEKKKDFEKERELSQNAQFRAIQPSPSILTFVEKNVICMKTFDCHVLFMSIHHFLEGILIFSYSNYYSQLLGRRRMIDIKRAGYNIELPSPLDNLPFSKSSERENIEENVSCRLLH